MLMLAKVTMTQPGEVSPQNEVRSRRGANIFADESIFPGLAELFVSVGHSPEVATGTEEFRPPKY
jgi:hypothetical protein